MARRALVEDRVTLSEVGMRLPDERVFLTGRELVDAPMLLVEAVALETRAEDRRAVETRPPEVRAAEAGRPKVPLRSGKTGRVGTLVEVRG